MYIYYEKKFLNLNIKNKKLRRGIKMAEQQNEELTSPHKHIKNTSTYGTILKENQLKTGRRSPIHSKLQERSPPGRMGEKKALGQKQSPWEGSVKERRSIQADLHSGSPLPAGKSTGTDRKSGEA